MCLGASGYQFTVAIVLHQLQSLLHPFFLRHNRVMSDGLFVLPPLLCNRHRYPGMPYSPSRSLLTKSKTALPLQRSPSAGNFVTTARDRTELTPAAIDCALRSMQLLESQSETYPVRIADLILPVFAVILSGWIVGYTGYLSRALSDALIHFAYNIAMPALLIVTIAQEPSHSLINWRFLVAFGGGSLLCFFLVFGIMSIHVSRSLASRTMHGMAASMTNTGFVALPVLQAIYGPRAVLPAAIATVFVAVVMFPIAVILLELGQRDAQGSRTAPMVTVKHVVLNPMVLSTLIGMLWSVFGLRMPGPVTAYFGILADALTPCALFAIGLGLSIDGLRANIVRASLLTAVKLVIMPLIVYGLSVSLGLDPLYTIAAVICAAVPTAKTAYILAGEYRCEEMMVASTVSMTTLASIISLVIWLYGLSGLATRITAR
jgi:malonate transporter